MNIDQKQWKALSFPNTTKKASEWHVQYLKTSEDVIGTNANLVQIATTVSLVVFLWRRGHVCLIMPRKWSLQRLCSHRCLSVHGGVCPIACWDTHPWADTPRQVHSHPKAGTSSGQVPPLRSACWDMINKWAVRIPLECILVSWSFFGKGRVVHPF